MWRLAQALLDDKERSHLFVKIESRRFSLIYGRFRCERHLSSQRLEVE